MFPCFLGVGKHIVKRIPENYKITTTSCVHLRSLFDDFPPISFLCSIRKILIIIVVRADTYTSTLMPTEAAPNLVLNGPRRLEKEGDGCLEVWECVW